ncbi:MAG: hypothetical protein ACYTFQ_19090 [Planctomycetota bacterium]|jgi:hypothetical protein
MGNWYAYDGGTWRDIQEPWAYDGSTWREICDAWVYDGSAWRNFFECVSCACGTANIDTFNRTFDAVGCTCQTSPKVIQQTRVCCRWNYTTDNFSCQSMQIQYTTGGSYITAGTVALNQSSAAAGGNCSGSTYEGYWYAGFCRAQTRQYRGRIVFTSDATVCDTSSTQSATNCVA